MGYLAYLSKELEKGGFIKMSKWIFCENENLAPANLLKLSYYLYINLLK